jgi:hypothetical protein
MGPLRLEQRADAAPTIGRRRRFNLRLGLAFGPGTRRNGRACGPQYLRSAICATRSKGPRGPAVGYGPLQTIYLAGQTGIDGNGKVAEARRGFRVRMRSHRRALKSIEAVKIRRIGRSESMWRLAADAGEHQVCEKTPRKGLTENSRQRAILDAQFPVLKID